MTTPDPLLPDIETRLEDIFSQNIQISRIGRATDPKPKDRIWFTTQMQDLFVLETDLVKKAIKSEIIRMLESLKQYNGAYIGMDGKRVEKMIHHDVIDDLIRSLQ